MKEYVAETGGRYTYSDWHTGGTGSHSAQWEASPGSQI